MIIRRVTLAEDFIRTNNLLLSNTADTDLADIIALVSRQKVLRIQPMIKKMLILTEMQEKIGSRSGLGFCEKMYNNKK